MCGQAMVTISIMVLAKTKSFIISNAIGKG